MVERERVTGSRSAGEFCEDLNLDLSGPSHVLLTWKNHQNVTMTTYLMECGALNNFLHCQRVSVCNIFPISFDIGEFPGIFF